MNGSRQQHHPGLADDLSGQEFERAEGEPQEHDRIDDQADHARGDHGRDEAAFLQAAYRPRDRRIPRADTRPPTRSPARAARPDPEMPAPIRIAATAATKPSRRCTRSRSTRAMPTISTPDGAISPGATGIRQGPSRVQTVPTLPIIQLADRNGQAEQDKKHRAFDPAPRLVRHRTFCIPHSISRSRPPAIRQAGHSPQP